MPIVSHALATSTEVKEELNVAGTARDSTVEECINRATGIIESFLDRQIIERTSGTTPVAYTEYYSLEEPVEALWLREWPIISITSVAESDDWPRDYSSTLSVGTNYAVSTSRGSLIRLDSFGPSTWQVGWRGIKVVYRAGYSALANVPYPIRDVARRLAALIYKEVDRGQQGISSLSDALGNWTRFGPAKLNDDMKYELAPFRRPLFEPNTVERE